MMITRIIIIIITNGGIIVVKGKRNSIVHNTVTILFVAYLQDVNDFRK